MICFNVFVCVCIVWDMNLIVNWENLRSWVSRFGINLILFVYMYIFWDMYFVCVCIVWDMYLVVN